MVQLIIGDNMKFIKKFYTILGLIMLFIVICLALVFLFSKSSNNKLKTENDLINSLNKKYNDKFIVLEKKQINNDKIEYKISSNGNTFTVIDELKTQGSDIGSKSENLNDSEIENYYKLKYSNEIENAKVNIVTYLKNKYNIDFTGNVFLEFYCKNNLNVCGYYVFTYKDNERCKIIFYDSDIKEECNSIY